MLVFDVVWFWVEGEWRGCTIKPKATKRATNEFARKIAKQHETYGFVAYVGTRSIGAPEGPPSAERLASVNTQGVQR